MRFNNIFTKTAAVVMLSGMMAGAVCAEALPEAPAAQAVPAEAPLMTLSKSGYVAITLPTDDWTEVAMEDTCVAFSDGKSLITFDHYGKNDDIWQPAIADGDTEYYYRSIDLHGDDKLVFEARSASPEEMAAIKKSIANANVNVALIPKDEKHVVAPDSYTIEGCDYMAYVVADELNVREQASRDSAALGSLYYGTQVRVIGKVLYNGAASGWVQIEYNGGKGFVSRDFLSDNAPQPKPDPQKPSRTGTSRVLYYMNSNSITVYEYTDGTWKDDDGVEYWQTTDRQWASSTGSTLYDYIPEVPENGAQKTGNSKEIYWENGNGLTIYEYTDGTWMDDSGIRYWYQNGDDAWHSSQNDTLYDDPDALRHRNNNTEQNPQITVSGEAGTVTLYGSADGSWADDNNRSYYQNENGAWVDPDGNEYFPQAM